MLVFLSVLGMRAAWYCVVSCMFEADDTCINPACSMPQDHQHVVGYVIGEECIKVFPFFSMQYVRALAQLFCRLAREDEQNNTLAHVMWNGFIQRCRRTLMFVYPIAYSKQLQWRTVLFRLAKRVVVWELVVLKVLCVFFYFCQGRVERQHHSSSQFRVGFFQPLANESLASDASAPSHCVRLCLRDLENTALRCERTPILLVLFVPVPVGRINCLLDLSSVWVSFLSLFRSGLVLVHSVQPT